MKYLFLLYVDQSDPPQPGTPEFGEMMGGYQAFHDALARDGIEWTGEALQVAATATTVKRRMGKTETMDGPYAETKEQLGGYYLIDLPDLDSAMKYAALIPAASVGSVEIRPVQVFN